MSPRLPSTLLTELVRGRSADLVGSEKFKEARISLSYLLDLLDGIDLILRITWLGDCLRKYK
jgi:hypothetical protein